MKILVDEDERYPDYKIKALAEDPGNTWDDIIDLPEDVVSKYLKIFEAYDEAQVHIGKLVDAARVRK